MAVLNGTKLLIFVDGVAIASLKENSINLKCDLPDATTKDSGGWADHIVGLKDWSGSGAGLYDPLNANVTADDIMEKIIAGTICEVMFSTDETGDVYYKGNAHFDSAAFSAPMEAAATYDVSFKGTGALTKGVVGQS